MKRFFSLILWALSSFFLLEATPTSLFWTNCNTDIQEMETALLTYDAFLRTCHSPKKGRTLIQDFGCTVGAFSWNGLQGEVGADYLTGESYPFLFNGKIGFGEGVLFENAPAVNVGIFNVGTRTSGLRRTNENIVDFLFGMSLPQKIGGVLTLGFFSGSSAMGKNRKGVMIGYSRTLREATDSHGKKYDKWLFMADYASGKNSIGGGGFSIKYYFTKRICLQTGPIWFIDWATYGKWRWALQIDIEI